MKVQNCGPLGEVEQQGADSLVQASGMNSVQKGRTSITAWVGFGRVAVVALAILSLFALPSIQSASAQDFGGLQDPFGDPFAAPGGDSGPDLTYKATFKAFPNSNRGEVSLELKIIPEHHVYSLTQIGGPGPSNVSILGEAVKATGPFTPSRDPDVTENDPVFETRVEKHKDKVIFTAPVEFNDDAGIESLEFELLFEGQVCSKNGCRMIEGDKIAATFDGYLEVPQKAGEYVPEMNHVKWLGKVKPAVATPGSLITLELTALPEEGWHIYGFKPQVDEEATESATSPTLIALTRRNNWQASTPRASVDPVRKVAEYDDSVSYYHEDPVTWSIDLRVPKDAKPGEYTIGGLLGFQTCNDSNCDLPSAAEIEAKVRIGEEAQVGEIDVVFTEFDGGYSSVDEEASKLNWEGVNGKSDLDRLPIAAIFGLAFLGGLILNVMPCVLPVIGLKIMSLIDQAGKSRWQALSLNIWYSFGIIAVFGLLATLAVFFGYNWGEQFQKPAFNISLIGIVFAFGLSLLGVWEVPIPGFASSGTTAKLAEKEGFVGAFAKGVLTTVLATPCVGPFVVPVVSWATSQPMFIVYTVFIALGLGMASPYLIVGMFPKLVAFLPRPGNWMVTFKQLMGFAMLSTAIFLFMSVEKTTFTLTLLLAIGIGCWWIGRTPMTAELPKQFRAWAIGLSIVGITALGTFGLEGYLKRNELAWEPFTQVALEENLQDGKTVLIDFTADWCATCKFNENTVLNTGKVKQAVQEYEIVTLKADMTTKSPEAEALLQKLGNQTSGIPYYVIYPGDGRPPIVFDGLLTQSFVIDKIKSVGDISVEDAPEEQLVKTDAENEVASTP